MDMVTLKLYAKVWITTSVSDMMEETDKKKIVWITPDYFFDVDWPIVGRLMEKYDIRWYVIWGKGSLRAFPDDKNIFKLIVSPYRYRDLRVIKLYFSLFKEIKKFEPSDIGQIGTYMVAVNRQLKRPDDQQTVGLVICREKDRVTVQYALESSSLPIGVSDYVLERFIPADFKSQLPTVEEVEGELTRRMEIAERHLGGMLADGTGVGLAVGER